MDKITPITPEQLRCRLALSMVTKIGPCAMRQLLDEFDNDELAIFDKRIWKEKNQLDIRLLESILLDPEVWRMADKELEFMEKESVKAIWYTDEDYPYRLKECGDRPLLLYQKGHCQLNARKVLSIVGTRRMTSYGRGQTEALVAALAGAYSHLLIVSGLACGVDVCSHQNALKYGLPTVGVMGTGMDQIYPRMNRSTALQMIEKGALLTELPHGTPGEGWRFVQRNRIVAGMCDACIVIESAKKGGSLITAKMARDYDREVFALPGRAIDPYSAGCNQLISDQTACILTDVENLSECLNWSYAPKIATKVDEGNLFENGMSPEEKYTQLSSELARTADLFESRDELCCEELCRKRQELYPDDGNSISQMLSHLLELEVKGILVSLPGGRYRLR